MPLKSSSKNVGKKSYKSTQQTQDNIECIENSVEKHKDSISSPSAVKPPYQQSPSPRIKFERNTKKIDSYKDSPLFQKICKRKPDEMKTEKKNKLNEIRKAYVEFFDPEIKKMQIFKCFPDKIAVKNHQVAKKIAQNECDDDCATNKELKEISKEYLIDQICSALLNEEVMRKTL